VVNEQGILVGEIRRDAVAAAISRNFENNPADPDPAETNTDPAP